MKKIYKFLGFTIVGAVITTFAAIEIHQFKTVRKGLDSVQSVDYEFNTLNGTYVTGKRIIDVVDEYSKTCSFVVKTATKNLKFDSLSSDVMQAIQVYVEPLADFYVSVNTTEKQEPVITFTERSLVCQ